MRVTAVRHWEVDFGFYNAIYVRIETDEGIAGESEVAMRRRTRSLAALIDELGEYLVGEDPTRIELHWERMYRDSFLGGTLLLIGISAIDIALWDLAGRAADVPVHRLLGGRFRDRIPIYCHARAGATPDEFAAVVRDCMDRGFRAIKTTLPGFYSKWTSVHHEQPARIPPRHTETEILPPAIWRTIAEWFAAARQVGGPDLQIMLDCHGRLSVANAIRLCEALEPYDLLFVEEPTPYERADWLREVARKTSIPIAAGERWGAHHTSAPFLESHAVAIAQPDVSLCGGLSAARKITTIAEAHAIGIAFHNPFGPLTSAATMHLAAVIPNLLISECMADPAQQALWTRYTDDPPRIEAGAWVVNDRPGLGTTLRIEEFVGNPPRYEYDRLGTR
jgi:galactonate dehydratase